MRTYNRYIIILVLAFSAVNTLMAFMGQDKLEVYFTVNLIAYLIISLLYAYLNPRAKKVLSKMWMGLFGGFVVLVVIRVAEILG